jgi:solute carrier family 13 (sodium-dependent dicarboxylate transporter), member 2/3/5
MDDTAAKLPLKRPAFWIGLALFVAMHFIPPPAGMSAAGWTVAALTLLMAIWWMSEAVPLTVTAFLPFLIVPFTGAMDAGKVAGAYYSPILFLILGGAFLALAIEKSGLHRRLALAIVQRAGSSATGLLFAFILATALLSMFISNTSTALIMMPIALAVLRAGGVPEGEKGGFAAALVLGIAFAATIGGLGTLVGSPTNAIAAGLIENSLKLSISFLDWMAYGVPIVLVSLPILHIILLRTQKVRADRFDSIAAQASIRAEQEDHWNSAERRLVPLLLLVMLGWVAQPWIEGMLPKDTITDGSIAMAGALLLFLIPSGGRDNGPLLSWAEANRAPWGIIMMFGGGLALAAAMGASGLAAWLGTALAPIGALPLILIALLITALVIAFTEFASNVATASGIMPVVAALAAGMGVDPILLVMPAALAASWGFILPAGTGPNAIAWASGHVRTGDMMRAGAWLDLAGLPILIGGVWAVHALIG